MALTCSCNRTMVILVIMALTGAVGIVLMFLGCAIDFHVGHNYKNQNWWALFVLVFYVLSPIPLALARRCVSRDVLSPENLSVLTDICYFLSACVVVSGFGFPFVLARRQIIQSVAAALLAGANIFVFGTVYSFFMFFGHEADDWDWSTF